MNRLFCIKLIKLLEVKKSIKNNFLLKNNKNNISINVNDNIVIKLDLSAVKNIDVIKINRNNNVKYKYFLSFVKFLKKITKYESSKIENNIRNL